MSDYKIEVALIAGLVVVLIAIVAVLWFTPSCEDRGGESVWTGEYRTTFIKSGDVMVPITSKKYECVGAR